MFNEIDYQTDILPIAALPMEILARASYDSRGVFDGGRTVELDALRRMGWRNPSLGRLYEGHFNAVLLIMLYGTSAQRAIARRDVKAGLLFGVWNTQADDPVTMHRHGSGFALRGSKTWASGARSVTRPLITARLPGGGIQLCLIPMERIHAFVDDSTWRPLGMEASESFRVCFDGAEITTDDIIGESDDYEREPWFHGGALRFAAVHAGIIERLAAETHAFLVDTNRDKDPMQIARAGELRIGAQGARNWLDSGIAAWEIFDRDPGEQTSRAVTAMADMARLAIERVGLDALELCIRAVGARGLVAPFPFASLVRDLTMYLRQPAPDSALARVGIDALQSASADLKAAIAYSTGSCE